MHFNLYFYFIFYKYNQYAFYHDILSSIVISKVSLLMSSSRNHLITCQRVSMAKPFRIWKLSLLMRSRRNHLITCQRYQKLSVARSKLKRKNHLIIRQWEQKTVSMTKRSRSIRRTTEHASTSCNCFGLRCQLVCN